MMPSFSWLAHPVAGPGAVPPVLEAVAKGTVLLVVVYLLTAALRRGSAGTRHLLWSGALLSVLALPLLSRVLPPLRVLPGATSPMPAAGAAEAPRATETSVAVSNDVNAPAERTQSSAPKAADGSAVPSAAPSIPAARASESPRAGSGESSLPRTLLFVWAVVAAALLGRVAAGSAAVMRIVRRGERLESPSWKRPLFEAADRLDLAREPRLLRSEDVQLPFTAGLFRATVVLPASADAWSDERRRAVLLHELAHVRRRDLLSHLLGRLACALYWFNPLVWLAARRARAESERACDDLVLSVGTRASAYADHLLQIVCGAAGASAPVVAIPMAQRSEFEGRMMAILEPGTRREAPGRLHSAAVVSGVALLALCVAAAAPAPAAAVADPAVSEAAAPPAPRALVVLADTPVTPARAPAAPASADTSWTRLRGRQVVGSLDPAFVGGAVERALDAVDMPRLSASASRAAARGLATAVAGGWVGPTPTPAPAPMPMVFGGWSSRDKTKSKFKTNFRQREQADARTIQALSDATRDPVADVRLQTVHALGELEDPRAVAALAAVLRSDSVAEVRRMAAWSLGQIEDSAAVAPLSAALGADADASVRRMAAWALGQIEPTTAPAGLVAALKDKDASVRRMAAWALGQIEDEATATALGAATDDADPAVRRSALWALGQIGGPAVREPLLKALKSSDPEVRKIAARAIANTF